MAASAFPRPDVLVLAGGGVVGEAWMQGVLAGIEDATGTDFRDTEAFVGTSAGSIVAASLVAGRRPRRPGAAPSPRTPPGNDTAQGSGATGVRALGMTAARTAWALSAPLAPAALALGAPGGALARSALLARMPDGRRSLDDLHGSVARSGARFDGRLRVCCVDRASGRRVVFGAPGAPAASVADAVVASCAIPWVFKSVEIGGREYVDGGVWSVTNLDAAPAGAGTHVLCLDVSASMRLAHSAMGALRQAFRVSAAFETQVMRRRGAVVTHVGPDAEAAAAIGSDLMDGRRAAGALSAGHQQGLTLA